MGGRGAAGVCGASTVRGEFQRRGDAASRAIAHRHELINFLNESFVIVDQFCSSLTSRHFRTDTIQDGETVRSEKLSCGEQLSLLMNDEPTCQNICRM